MTDKPKLLTREELENDLLWWRQNGPTDFQMEWTFRICRTALHYLDEAEKQARALRRIVSILGPEKAGCSGNVCDGCHSEMSEALLTAKKALGDK